MSFNEWWTGAKCISLYNETHVERPDVLEVEKVAISSGSTTSEKKGDMTGPHTSRHIVQPNIQNVNNYCSSATQLLLTGLYCCSWEQTQPKTDQMKRFQVWKGRSLKNQHFKQDTGSPHSISPVNDCIAKLETGLWWWLSTLVMIVV